MLGKGELVIIFVLLRRAFLGVVACFGYFVLFMTQPVVAVISDKLPCVREINVIYFPKISD